MHDGSTFRRLGDASTAAVTLHFEGEPVEAREGDSVAAALLAAGHLVLRTTPVSGAARGPLCMMGVCFECLLEIDGMVNLQGCMTAVRCGMQVRRMHGARAVAGGDDDV